MQETIIVGEEKLDKNYVEDLKEWSAENDKKRAKEKKERKAYKTTPAIDAYHEMKDRQERKEKTSMFIPADKWDKIYGE